MKKIVFLVAMVLSGCTSLNQTRHELEPLTDINCVIANQVEAAINPSLINITTQVCNTIKQLRPALDNLK